jgi:23S rRNA (guanosine2251-2'-O)-methyltransferase
MTKNAAHGRRAEQRAGASSRPSDRRLAANKAGPRGHGERGQTIILFGWHAVKAALENPRREIHKLYATDNAARRLAAHGIALPSNAQLVRPDDMARRLPAEAIHQGLLAEVAPLPGLSLANLPGHGIALVLDQITDPQNVGAILRTAAAFAVTAVVTPIRHSPEATGVLAKCASGALELVPLIAVTNLARALEEMKELGFLLIGLDGTSAAELSTTALRLPLALILGAEGKGLRRLTRQTCDLLARLALPGQIKSLNVSNATALALYIATMRLTPRQV